MSDFNDSNDSNSTVGVKHGRGNRRGSAAFLMFKDMEVKEEFQKVKMAGFLRELHKLAIEDTKEKVKAGIMRTTSKGHTEKSKDDDGTLSLAGMDLTNFTPAQAKEKIEAIHAGENFDSVSLIQLAQAAIAIMSEEETVVDLRKENPALKEVMVVGDLHGSLNCLMSVLELTDVWSISQDDADRVVVFDGDFVDRGTHSLEVLSTLLLIKISHPTKVILLRGNHEDSMTASTYGFREEIDGKYGYDVADDIWYEFGHLFAAFPIIARSNQAAIMHGGIPMEDFTLEIANALDKEVRCELKTIADPYDDDERLVQGILWSDPSDEPGLNHSDRGAGFLFGPDISKEFLDHEDLKYIIRAHEPFEDGSNFHDVGDGKGVITIFSTANYPEGEGSNNGAVLVLDDITGEYTTPSFIHTVREGPDPHSYDSWLTTIVNANKSELSKAFRSNGDDNGTVTIDQWVTIVGKIFEMEEVPWDEIQPVLVPTTVPDGDKIDWMAFITRISPQIAKIDNLSGDQRSLLQQNREAFLDIFQLLDTDCSGSVSEEEFVSGINMLNEQIGNDSPKVEDPVELYKQFDADGDGEIDIKEFCEAIKKSTMLQGISEKLEVKQIETLKENNEMLLLAFKYLDTDHSGAIDREEFARGVELLNLRLPERNKLGDPQELFALLDADGNGEIGKYIIA